MDDGIPSSVATTGCQEGSGCAAFNFDNGDANPNEMPAGALRRKFTASDGVYISAWVKLSSNWVGSGQPYHPHVFYLMTDADADDWQGPYGSPSTAYMEVLNATPQIGFQDGANINSSYIGQSLYGVTETRAAHGCNGWNDYHTWEVQDCYQDGVWVNGRMTRASSGISLNAWHHFEAYYQMNSIVNSVAQSDGIMRLWVDGVLLKDFSDLILRTNTRANMKWNKLLIAPYIGDGSPAVQSITIDNLVVMDAAPTTPLVGILQSGISASGVTFR